MKKQRLIDRIVYRITVKPKHYVEVKDPPKTVLQKLMRPQDARQIQYNNWSKALQIYSGSYLPYRAEELLKQGWSDTTSHKNKTNHIKSYQRKTTNQVVERHQKHINKKGELELTHYHWENPAAKNMPKKQKYENYNLDIYGNPCEKHTPPTHIKPHRTRRKIK